MGNECRLMFLKRGCLFFFDIVFFVSVDMEGYCL